jgi:uncharacterized membrane protein
MSRPGAPLILGFALGGLFDGILLHQILQWHHLLSLVPGERMNDLAFQILADGLFHLLMYALALAGLVWLWRVRRGLSGREVLGWAILGFGAWNMVDVVVFHWALGIHNVRLDTSAPVAWDVGWLLVLGVLPALGGLSILRSGPRPPPGPAAAGLAAIVLFCGIWSLAPAGAGGETIVVFWPGAELTTMLEAVAAVDGRIIQMQEGSTIMSLRLAGDASVLPLFAHGAALVSSAAPGVCISNTRVV